MWIVPPVAGLIEPAISPEIYADGIGAIEVEGGCVRIILVANQMPIDGRAAEPHRIVVAKIRGPLTNIPTVIGKLSRCMWRQSGLVRVVK